jgi:protein-disulfide isomerase
MRAPPRSPSLLSLLSLSLSVGLAALVLSARPAHAGFDPAAVYNVPDAGAPTSGAADASITIVEFSDYACGYCIRARATLAGLELIYPGRVRWVHRSVPFISGTSLGAEAAHAAAAQGQLEAMEALLYAAGGKYDRVGVEMMAQSLGLDMLRFRADLDAGTARAAIDQDVAIAHRLGVTVTPAFFINGRPVLGSAPLSTFSFIIEQELLRAAATQRESGLSGAALYQKLVGSGLPAADPGPRIRTPQVELSPSRPHRVGLGLPGLSRGGGAAAPVTLVVFSDFECQFCARNEPALLHIQKVYGPQLRIVFRHLPLPFHRRAQLAAEATMAAAAQGKFWELHDRLFSSISSSPGALDRANLLREAEAIGLDMARFRAELDAHTHRDAVRLDAAGASALGVDGTPMMFLNGLAISGFKSPAQLEEAVRLVLEESKRVIAAGIAAEDIYAVAMSAAVGREHADPSTVPVSRAAASVQLSDVERLQVVTAACRRRVAADAKLAPLPEPLAAIAQRICAVYGIAR